MQGGREFGPQFGLWEDYNLNFVEAHSCLQANTDGKLMSRHTTVNDIQANQFTISSYVYENRLETQPEHRRYTLQSPVPQQFVLALIITNCDLHFIPSVPYTL